MTAGVTGPRRGQRAHTHLPSAGVRQRAHLARVGGSLALTDLSASLVAELRRIGLSSLVLAPAEALDTRLVPAEAAAR